MKIFLNNLELNVDKTFNNITEIIEYAEKKASENDSIVEGVFIDEKAIDEIKDKSIDNIEKIEIFIKKTGIVILESLQEMNNYLDKLRFALENVITLLQDYNEREAMNKLHEISEGLEWVYSILNYAQTLNKISFKEIDFDIVLDKFKGILPEVVESLENRDNILLSDLLNYELLPIIDEIMKKLPIIYEKILDHEKKELNKKIS